jgi:peroxiredoxin
VAASEKEEQAGSEQYHEDHMGAIFKKGFSFSGYERDLLSLNLGQGKFLAISGISGVDSISDGRGSVFGDFDNDGDPDIFLTTAQGEAHYLFRNNVGAQNGFLRIDVQGTRAARDAFGTVVRVKTASGLQTKLKTGGSGFLSHHDSRLLFGLGEDDAAEWVEVVWPDRSVQRFENVPAGSAIRVVQGSSDFTALDERRFGLADPLDKEETFLAGLGFALGERFPDLNLTADSGEPLKLHQLLRSGRHTLLNIWATWCTPCAQEMPELQKLYPDLTGAGVDLVGVSVDLDTVEHVSAYIRERKITYPIYTTDEAALETLYPRGEATVPLTLLLDGEGRVLEIHSGWSRRTEQGLHDLISRKGE